MSNEGYDGWIAPKYSACRVENRLFNLFYPQLDRLDIYTDWKTYTDTDKTGYMIVCQCAKQ